MNALAPDGPLVISTSVSLGRALALDRRIGDEREVDLRRLADRERHLFALQTETPASRIGELGRDDEGPFLNAREILVTKRLVFVEISRGDGELEDELRIQVSLGLRTNHDAVDEAALGRREMAKAQGDVDP